MDSGGTGTLITMICAALGTLISYAIFNNSKKKRIARYSSKEVPFYVSRLIPPEQNDWYAEKLQSILPDGTPVIYIVASNIRASIKQFYQFIKDYTPEQAEIIKRLQFVSVRGRTAWSLMCLEQALQHLDAYNAAWQELLPQLWKHSQAEDSAENDILDFLYWWEDALMMLVDCAESCEFDGVSERFEDGIYQTGDWNPTKEQIEQIWLDLRGLHPSLFKIMNAIWGIGLENVYEGSSSLGASETLEIMKIVDEMVKLNIALPSVEPFLQYEYRFSDMDHLALGPAFDGTQYSIYVGKDNN